ncbi:unnamed protein product, partial [marine sediment metagenome]
SPKTVCKEFSGLMKAYGISKCTGDRFAVGYVKELFRDNAVLYEPSKLSASELYLECQVLFTIQKIELPDDKRMKEQFKNLERKVRSGSRDFVSHPTFGDFHDDIANSVSGACVMLAMNPNIKASDLEHMLPHRAGDFTHLPSHIRDFKRRTEEMKRRKLTQTEEDDCEKILQDHISDGGKKKLGMFVKRGKND